MTLVVPLEKAGPEMLPHVGGKAANLGELIRAGFAVPQGVCVTTEAYRIAVDAAGRERLATAPVPEPVAEAVLAAYHELGTGVRVAVRSSATAEDLPHASFAGQQDTFLNVAGDEAVLDAVRRCWASLWTERAVSYRERNQIDHDAVQLAVVIQEMVDAEVAGVLFTANPITGRRHEAVVDASPGLGEAVVSGAVNPDHFEVTPDGAIRRDGDCLTDTQVTALAAIGTRVEDHFGAPQDIEWAVAPSGRIWLTQTRAITSLYPLPEGPGVPGGVPPGRGGQHPLKVYFSFNVAQGVYRPLTPMGLSLFEVLLSAVSGVAKPKTLAEAGARLFLDVTPALRSRLGRALLRRALGVAEARSAVVIDQLLADRRLEVAPGADRRFVLAVARFMLRARVPIRLARALRDPAAFQSEVAAIPDRVRARAAEPGVDVERLMREQAPPMLFTLAPVVFPTLALSALARRLLGDLATADEYQTILRSLPHNPTTEMDLELWRVAQGAGGATNEGLDEFLATYGHRGVAEIDVGLPRWAEDPAHILGVIENYRRLDDPERAPDVQFERGRRAAEATVATLTARARTRGRLRGALVGFLLRRVRALAGTREMPKFCVVVMLGEARRMLRAEGETLVAAGRLDHADDVFFLRLAELRQAGDLRGPVQARREEYDRELRRRHVPRVLLSDGTEPEAVARPGAAADASANGALTGTPASAGVVTGRARVVLEPVGAHLEPGEILVAPSTDPGWTPLFLTAGGLVMEMGGAMSHGAVVAREYGIPAVVGVAGATERIETGQEVTVDGSAGSVVPAPG